MHQSRDAVFLQFRYDVHHAGIAYIRHIFLERKAQQAHARALDVFVRIDEALDAHFCHILAHAVVDAAASKDNLRVAADFFGLVGQIIGIHANAVPTHKTRPERQEVPLAASGFKHFQRINAHTVKNKGQLVHQGNVDIALRVFNNLGGLGHLYARGPVDARRHHRAIDLNQQVCGGGVRAGNNLTDGFKPVNLVTRIDALG